MLVLAIAIGVAAATPASAYADDWLLLHPRCAYEPPAETRGAILVYPRLGLPALVHAGERLVARVRVNRGLTRPPGVQQPRHLEDWWAELRGDAVRVPDPATGAAASQHRYPVRVVRVRAADSSSLIYRVTIPVPRWIAPGTYTLRMHATGGVVTAVGGVRVLEPGAAPRIGLLGAPPPATEGEHAVARLRALGAVLARLPIDAWVARDAPAWRRAFATAPAPDGSVNAQPVPPLLLLPRKGMPVVLDRGDAAWALGRCTTGPVPFADRVRAVAHVAGRSLERAPPRWPAAGRWRPLGSERARPWPAPDAVMLRTEGDALVVRASGGLSMPVQVRAQVPDDGRSTGVDGAEPAWWPGGPVASPGYASSIVAKLRLEPGKSATVRRGKRQRWSLALVGPGVVETSKPLALRAEAGRPLARVAWVLREDLTAEGPKARVRWGGVGRREVHALAIAADGSASRASHAVRVRPRESRGCAAGGGRPGAGGAGMLLLAAAAGTIRRGNRPRHTTR